MTKKWTITVSIYPDEEAFRNNQPLRSADVWVEHDHQHHAMAIAEHQVRENLPPGSEGLQVWATEAIQESD